LTLQICKIFVQATGSWDYSVRVWALRKDDNWKSSSVALQENGHGQTDDGIRLLQRLTGHTGNIHTVAFSRADMLVTHKTHKLVHYSYLSAA